MAASSSSIQSSTTSEIQLLHSICQENSDNIDEAVKELRKLRLVDGRIEVESKKVWDALSKKKKKSGKRDLRVVQITYGQQTQLLEKLTNKFSVEGSLSNEDTDELLDALLMTGVVMKFASCTKMHLISTGHKLQYLLSQVVNRQYQEVRAEIEHALDEMQKSRSDDLISKACNCMQYIHKLQRSTKWLTLPSASNYKDLSESLLQLCASCVMLGMPRRGVNEVHRRNTLAMISNTLRYHPKTLLATPPSLLFLDNREEFLKKCITEILAHPEMLESFIYYAVTTSDRAALRVLRRYHAYICEIPMWIEFQQFHVMMQHVLKLENDWKVLKKEQLTTGDFLCKCEKMRTFLKDARMRLGYLGSAFKLVPKKTSFGKEYHGMVGLMHNLEADIHYCEDYLLTEPEYGFLGYGETGFKALQGNVEVPEEVTSTVLAAKGLLGKKRIYFGKQMPYDIASLIAHRDEVAFVLYHNEYVDEHGKSPWMMTYWNAHGQLIHQRIKESEFSLSIEEFAKLLDPTILEVFLDKEKGIVAAVSGGAASSSSAGAPAPVSNILDIRSDNFNACIQLIKQTIFYKKRGTIWEAILNDLEKNASKMGWTQPDRTINLTAEKRGSDGELKENEIGTITTTKRSVDKHHYSFAYAQILAASAVEEYSEKIALLDNKESYSSNKGAQLVFALTGLATHSKSNDLTLMTTGEMSMVWLIQESYRLAKEKKLLLDWFVNGFKGLCFEDRYRNLLEYFEKSLYKREPAAGGGAASSKQEQAGALLTAKDTVNEVVYKCLNPFQESLVKSLGLKVAPALPDDDKYDEYDALLTMNNFIHYIKEQFNLNELPTDAFSDTTLKDEIEPLGVFF